MDVIIPPSLEEEMILCAKEQDYEVGGGQEVFREEGALLLAPSTEIIKQVAGSAEVTYDLDALDRWREEHLPKNEEAGLPYGDYSLWHSHVSMGTSPSTTDQEFVEDHSGRGWLVYIIVNKRGEMNVRCHTYAGGVHKKDAHFCTVKPEVVRGGTVSEERVKELKAEMKEKHTPLAVVVVDGEGEHVPYSRSGGKSYYPEQGGGTQGWMVCTKCEHSSWKCKCDRPDFVSELVFAQLKKGGKRSKHWGRKGKKGALFSVRMSTHGGLVWIDETGQQWMKEPTRELLSLLTAAGVPVSVVALNAGSGKLLVVRKDGGWELQ
jgi:hypothetical protein